MRSLVELFRSPAWSRSAILVATAVIAAGCSSESSRFSDSPFSNPYASRNAPPGGSEVTGSIPAQQSAPGPRVESRPLPRSSYQSGSLPPPQQSTAVAGAGVAGGARGIASYQPAAAPSEVTGSVSARPQQTAQLPPPPTRTTATNNGQWNWDGGTPVTVGAGETIDVISRRYGVPATAIAQANGLAANAAIYPGQRLVIPRYNYPANPVATSGAPPTRTAAPARPAPAVITSGTKSPSGGIVHVVAPGENLTKIAKMYRRPLTEIAAANNIPPYKMVRMGERIVIPGVHAAAPAPRTVPVAQTRTGQRMVAAEPVNSAHLITPAKESVNVEPTASVEPMGSSPNFRWPVRGRIIAGFGPKPTGQQNDGINLAVPEGTPIKAADDGVVAYAGNELKGYGNLVLVRHSNGYVTAYAHASELMVKRGDQIKRGQVIARSGQTGNATSPQLHFEIRKGASPIDPLPLLTGAT